MTKIIASFILATILTLGLTFCSKDNTKQNETKGKAKFISPIKVETIAKTTAAKLKYKGNPSLIKDQIIKLAVWVNKKQLKITGAPYCLYFDDPRTVKPEDCRNEIYFPVESKPLKDGEYEVVNVSETNVVSGIAQGPYSDLGYIYPQIFDYIAKNNLTMLPKNEVYVREDYLDDPTKVKPEEVKTKICIPIKK